MLNEIQHTVKDYSELVAMNMDKKLAPINKSIEDIQTRLEEFQTVVYFAKQERIDASQFLTSVFESKEELEVLFKKIDSIEELMEHAKSNLNTLEMKIDKAEEELGCTDSKTSKVANIFTPLFKKNGNKSESNEPMPFLKTEDYFQ